MRTAAFSLLAIACVAPLHAGPRFIPQPSAERVRAMVPAGGKLWCATEGGVLVVSGAQCERRITTADGLPGTEIVDLETRGTAVVAVTKTGAYTLPAQIGERVQPTDLRTAPPGSPVREILRLVRQDRLLWAAGPDGVGAWDGKQWLPDAAAGLPSGTWVTALFSYRDQVYAGSLEGLWRRDTDIWQPVAEAAALQDLRAGTSFRGELWIAAGSSLFNSSDGLEFHRQASLPGVTCLASVPGSPDQLYAGTRDRGLWRHAGARWEPVTVAGPPGGLAALAIGGEELWAGSFSGKTAVLTEGRWREVPGPGPDGEGVAQLICQNGDTWCRMSNGALWRQHNGPWERVDRPWASALCVADGKVCVGGLGMAWTLDGDHWRRIEPPRLGRTAVTTIMRVGGQWWIGTQRGLYRECGPGRWAHYSLGTGLDDPWVTALAAWRGQVWAGTFAGGLFVFERERWKPAPVEGLRQVTSLAVGERLWCAGTDGIWERDGTHWHRYGAEDGLASAGPYALAAIHGRLAVASAGGIAIERPSGLRRKEEGR